MTTADTPRLDRRANAAAMRQRLNDELLNGHGCSMCERVEIDSSLPIEIRQELARTLWRIHLTKASRRGVARRRNARTSI
jgi:hypothetical protein